MAIAFDTTSKAAGDNVSSLSWSHTCTGSDRVLFVSYHSHKVNNRTVSSITYNGVGLTQVSGAQAQNGTRYVDVWYLINPASGSNTVLVTLSGGELNCGALASSYTGVDQTMAIGTAAAANGNSTAPSVSVSAATDDLVADFLTIEHAGTLTVGAGQTSRHNAIVVPGGWNKSASSTEPGAVSVTMSWSDTIGGPWAMVGVPMNPATAAGSSIAAKMFQYRLRRG
jgi:hypothetical protein